MLLQVLEALEAEPLLAPTHASRDERKRLPYDRQGLVGGLKRKRLDGFCLWRGNAPKYSDGYVSANSAAINWVVLDFRKVREAQSKEILEAWTRLNDIWHPEFAQAHYASTSNDSESRQYNAGRNTPPKKIRDNGFSSMFARTWFGPDLTSFIGVERLLSLPHTTTTSWGGVQLDLVEEPWAADFPVLHQRQQETIRIFNDWGLMGDYSNPARIVPGPKWKPRPWEI